MKLTHEDIEEFKQIYREEFGEELSDADAEARARQLLTLYEIVLQVLIDKRHPRTHPGCPHIDGSNQSNKVNNTDRG